MRCVASLPTSLNTKAGVVTSLASTAAVASTLGTYGSTVFGRSMINRTAQVSEFGFCSLDEAQDALDLAEALMQAEPGLAMADSTASLTTDSDLTSADQPIPSRRWRWSWKSTPGAAQAAPVSEPQSPTKRDGGEEASISGEALGMADASPAMVRSWSRKAKSMSDIGALPNAAQDEEPTAATPSGKGQVQQIKGSSSINGSDSSTSSSWISKWWAARPPLPTLPAPVNLKPDRCRLAVTVAVNGWVQKPEDFAHPWKVCLTRPPEKRSLLVLVAVPLPHGGVSSPTIPHCCALFPQRQDSSHCAPPTGFGWLRLRAVCHSVGEQEAREARLGSVYFRWHQGQSPASPPAPLPLPSCPEASALVPFCLTAHRNACCCATCQLFLPATIRRWPPSV